MALANHTTPGWLIEDPCRGWIGDFTGRRLHRRLHLELEGAMNSKGKRGLSSRIHTPRTPPGLTWSPQLVRHGPGALGRMLERMAQDRLLPRGRDAVGVRSPRCRCIPFCPDRWVFW